MAQPKKEVNKQATLKRVLAYVIKNYKWRFMAVFVLILIAALCMVRFSLFMQTLIDSYVTPLLAAKNPDFSGLAHAIFQLIIIGIIGVASTYTYNRLMVYVGQGTIRHIRINLFTHMESLPIKYFDTHAHGDIMSIYTNDVDTLRQLIGQSIPQVVNSSFSILTTFVSMLVLNVPLSAMSVFMVIVLLYVARKIAAQSSKYFHDQQNDLGRVNGFIEEMMDGQKVVKVFNHEERAKEDFRKLNQELRESATNANIFANILMPVSANIGHFSYVLCAMLGAVLALNGYAGLTLGTLVSFLALNRGFTNPITQISQQINSVVMAMAGADRVFQLLDAESELDEGYVELVNAKEDAAGNLQEVKESTGTWAWKHPHEDGTVTYHKQEGRVTFTDVTFGYNDDKMVLHDINLFAEPGQKIAFVGSTGAGKTTITNLINRFYDIQEGKIHYDGINIRKIKKADLRRSLGIVLQDTHLFTGTVMDNIRYGRLNASDEECIEAAKLANAHDFIKRLPEGYNTILTGDGSNLSQGQRQLLAIARAAVANPPALILDEATSSIDTRTEVHVQEGMDALMKGRTTFVIAHRLSTVRNADCIMVLEQGRIIERGNHDELIAQKARYYQLYTGNAISE
ncbi:ABC transporter ATP-binding protein [Streptococcus lutetiensis]|uniref:ABC transporter n=1 Tax=Streptococcus lutetiensis TaxID=150055 RepID=A0AB38G4P0_9STRE|nr:ABC transporter ATP-binding protein [Streptococcus lutetiensis]MBT0888910.1 ABC transporter ATP-binding protein/permease [Streptococcus lutetiensis]MBT0913810.1 ABC transporter ATP-binding protein/permease [Streptococcus lutetiensis]MBT0915500.1 ABC transporter ATP-binding protein/permease [Streptococcus lutetiensis]MBT0918915.1 ABC transporter ATP-binding protein/permease [Streptococcus lutetiensis]MBT0920602.1 ABC transporter ATP-binding protein/permease [Streptococcus lutetiensis]